VASDLPKDDDLLTDEDFRAYAAALKKNGFFGPDSWYMNHEANAAYVATSKHQGRLAMPVLFLHGEYDWVCETVRSNLAEPMRETCANLTEVMVKSGHWMAQEKPAQVSVALARWLAVELPALWPASRKGAEAKSLAFE
jgi:pimeloyl-ACP methyl ester carboxylesterase